MQEIVWIGLGSNIGNRAQHLDAAIDALAGIMDGIRCSGRYETPALLPKDAPEDWNIPFLNQVVSGETRLEPLPLLERLQQLETTLGRQRRGVWGPREIDLDILAYGERTLQSDQLTLPHSQMHRRAFVLLPMAELSLDWQHPALGLSVQAMLEALPPQEKQECRRHG
jgi:2-amino-4-hydroxy-6-hydroxymethyldihydropteridine diphosphokinase